MFKAIEASMNILEERTIALKGQVIAATQHLSPKRIDPSEQNLLGVLEEKKVALNMLQAGLNAHVNGSLSRLWGQLQNWLSRLKNSVECLMTTADSGRSEMMNQIQKTI